MSKLKSFLYKFGGVLISPLIFLKDSSFAIKEIISSPKKTYGEWKDLDMKWQVTTKWAGILLFAWLFFGCGLVEQEYAKKIRIKSEPILNEFQEIFVDGHSWEGVPEEEKVKQIKIREDQIKGLRDLINSKIEEE